MPVFLRSSLFRVILTKAPILHICAPRMSAAASSSGPADSNGVKKRHFSGKGNYRFKNKKQKENSLLKSAGTNEEVLSFDIKALLEKVAADQPQPANPIEENGEKNAETKQLPELFSELEVTVSEISSTGDGLGFSEDSNQVYVVPFTVPGDVVTAKVFKHFPKQSYSLTDFVKLNTPSPNRDDSLIKCPYFSSCSGCQFQMLPYESQLAHKKTIVEKAYRHFSNLPPELIPVIQDTMGSPLQYGYRTKLTPHFDGPPSRRSDRRNGIKAVFAEVPPIGFMKKGTRKTIDIEDCPIGTEAVRLGMKRERKRVASEIDKYHKGATLLLREHTRRIPNPMDESNGVQKEEDIVLEDRGEYIHAKSCVTDPNAKSTEYIDDFQFVNPAGAFFQNNNSILPSFTSYIRSHILPPDSDSLSPKITNLIDAYSGSGLFTITLSSLFTRSVGIDIAASSIESARHNARLNNLPESQASFIAADAANLFASVSDFPAAETAVVLDPPRKGCDESFLRQLIAYSPARILYVSCNVHTQARDVGILVGGMEGVDGGFGPGNGVYEIESLRGFDFFPQTGHVEGVAVLRKRSAEKSS